MFHPLWHSVFDVVAYGASALAFRHQLRTIVHVSHALQARAYWLSLVAGAIPAAYLFGSWNLSAGATLQLGHSVAGAIAGGILGAEIYKWRAGIRESTGAIFVIPLSLGIGIGRVGCFMAGLADQTFGIATTLPWGVDFGDGIRRHPVQLYESGACLGLAALAAIAGKRYPKLYARYAFHVFVLFYATQRFFWEFLKPYPELFAGLNLFHFLCAALFAYSLLMIGRTHARHAHP